RILLLPAVIRLHRRRQFRQHVKARKHVQILQHWNIFLRNLRLVVRGMRPHPNRRQQQHCRGDRYARRRSEPCPPALLQRLRRHPSVHAQIKRLGRLNHRQLVEQAAHRAKFIRAQTAPRARSEVLFHLQPLAFLQAPVHVSQNFLFHPAATHNFLPFLTLTSPCLALYWQVLRPVAYFPCCATRGASSTRSVSYARNSSDFSALSEHCKIFAISP